MRTGETVCGLDAILSRVAIGAQVVSNGGRISMRIASKSSGTASSFSD